MLPLISWNRILKKSYRSSVESFEDQPDTETGVREVAIPERARDGERERGDEKWRTPINWKYTYSFRVKWSKFPWIPLRLVEWKNILQIGYFSFHFFLMLLKTHFMTGLMLNIIVFPFRQFIILFVNLLYRWIFRQMQVLIYFIVLMTS